MFFSKREESPSSGFDYLIAGLGNPGEQYAFTRHNAGFLALDEIAARAGIRVKSLKFKSLYGTGQIAGKKVVLIKPQTFMNASGEALRDAAQFYKIPMEKVIVLYDDISLDVGRLRIRRKGSDGGHNGIKSILYLTGSDQFPRIKLGVGKKPHPEMDLADWVLSRFTKEEGKLLEEAIDKAAQALELMIQDNTEEAMNRFNS
ncbi:MAG: aminoacyl-tRNA hydrolase [Oscillospiraceae bacterium]|jgi:PTH1 family peptidyl-tRNA hydrolase|nr:aminoacyl-tRNA hydrolase [Oscillospiraceae bacterium]